MTEPLWGASAIALAWGLFGLVHSALSRSSVKRAAERLFGPAFLAGLYRPLYAALSAVMIVWLWVFPGKFSGDIEFFRLPGALFYLPIAAKGGAAALIAACFREISFAEFAGFGQLSRWLRGELKDSSPTPSGEVPMTHRDEPLAAQGVYVWVRHPLNTAAFIWIWSQPVYTAHNIVFAACLTAYVLIGNRYEERDLIARYGAAYEGYREAVPAFFGGFPGRRRRTGNPGPPRD